MTTLHDYLVHAPITYDDARQFMLGIGNPFTNEDTMRALAEMRKQYALEMVSVERRMNEVAKPLEAVNG